MTSTSTTRRFQLGTTGWSAEDLNDPAMEARWEAGRYEIIEGVLTAMPAARYDGNRRLRRLVSLIERHLREQGRSEEFVFEVDLILSQTRVVTADAVLMTPDDEQKQREENARRGQPQHEFGRILVPPTMVIESVSTGHEQHDRLLKRDWYARAGVKHYWILDPQNRSLECLTLEQKNYRIDQSVGPAGVIRPSALAGFVLDVANIW